VGVDVYGYVNGYADVGGNEDVDRYVDMNMEVGC